MKWFNSLDKYISYRNGIVLEDASKNPLRNWNKFTKVQENASLSPIFILNNELFDALPIKKFIFSGNEWREILVDIDKKEENINTTNFGSINNTQNNLINSHQNNIQEIPKFKFVYSQPNNDNVLKYLDPVNTFKEQGIEVKEGDMYEFSPEQIRYMYAICFLLASTKHAQSLIIDYGEDQAFSNSFRGIKSQKIIKGDEILNFSGECDLTSYVNFKALKKVVYNYPNLAVGGLMKQGDFLEILQIFQRLKFLQTQTNSMRNKEVLLRQYEKLVNENEMGDNYKFLYIHKKIHNSSYPFIDEILSQLKNEN
jgi:NADH dehydrogenase [ubiquinone] 1 alpha subcomplex assembly factor 7